MPIPILRSAYGYQFIEDDTFQVYMASRSSGKMDIALERLESDDTEDGQVLSINLDLGDPRKAKAAAKEFMELEDRLDILSASIHSPLIVGALKSG